MAIHSHRDLVVWQKSIDLTVAAYRLTDRFPHSEQYRLTSQLTRAAASVPANIAEGAARATRKEFAHFVSISRGSLAEVETFLTLAVRLGYLAEHEVGVTLALAQQVGKMLTVLHQRLAWKR